MVREPATPVAFKGILLETIKVFSNEQANAGVTEITLIGEVVLMGPAPPTPEDTTSLGCAASSSFALPATAVVDIVRYEIQPPPGPLL